MPRQEIYAAGQDHYQGPYRLRLGQDPLGEPICLPSAISSVPNHTSRPSSAPAEAAETVGRSPNGTEGPRLQLPAGQGARAVKPIVAQNPCVSEPPWQARGSLRPAGRQQRERHHPPVGGATAARAAIVPATALTDCGCSLAATVHPPGQRHGAAADEITPRHGTTRTTITVGGRGAWGSRVRCGVPWHGDVAGFGPYSPAPSRLFGGKDVGGLGGAWASGCCVHGGQGGLRESTGGNHQQRDRFPAADRGRKTAWAARNRGQDRCVEPDVLRAAMPWRCC